MIAPRACPDPWTVAEDEVCALFAEHEPACFVGYLLVAGSILAAGAFGAGVTWLVLRVTGWLQP